MDKLEKLILQKESEFIATVQDIIGQQCSSRVQMALIYKAHVRCLVAIDDLVAEVKLATPPAGEASSN